MPYVLGNIPLLIARTMVDSTVTETAVAFSYLNTEPQQRMRLELGTRQFSPAAKRLMRSIRLRLAEAEPEATPLDISVCICTYNGESRLPEVLECLLWQMNIGQLAWEVIVIDNNSSDGTAAVVEQFRQKWPRHVPLRYGFEPRQGASYARQRAIELARSPLVGFLDDDNNPAPLWVFAAYWFGHQHPQAGVYGSRIQGIFEVIPPPHFERIGSLLALTERGAAPLLYAPDRKVLPPGAGLVVRRQAWLEGVPTTLSLAERVGMRVTGEDLEIVLYIQRRGWDVWYNPAMRVQHRIPGQRLQRGYLLKLCQSIGLSRHRTRMLSLPRWQRPLVSPLYMMNDCRKMAHHVLKHRLSTFSDTVSVCELTLYWYSFLSLFYFWQRSLRQRFF
jgi:glycosyltransferase involved in cell wall biosynthesis